MVEALDKKARRKAREEREAQRGGKPEPKKKSRIREWLDAIVFALVFMIILRTLFVGLFRIPTPSMEKTLLVGDYIVVSKLHYGTRTPVTLGLPFSSFYLTKLPWRRLPGFTSPKRFDVIVFNWPTDRGKPIDRKMHYIKRIIGVPSDTLALVNKIVHINGDTLRFRETQDMIKDTMQQFWWVYKSSPDSMLKRSELEALGVEWHNITPDRTVELVRASGAASKVIAAWDYVDRITPAVRRPQAGWQPNLYPSGRAYTTDNFGPIVIPGKGMTVTLTDENWAVYEPVIRQYEGRTITRTHDGEGYEVTIDQQPASTYTFEQDYFFVLGDSRDNSEDSRYWGFVPMDHVVGRAVAVYFSWSGSRPRFARMFNPIR